MPSLAQRGPWEVLSSHSQRRECHRMPACPATVFPAGSVLAPACLLPRLPGCSSLRALLPVLPGTWHCQWDWGDWRCPCQLRWVPVRLPPLTVPGPHFKTLLSHPHPPPLTSGSFRMQLNTSALKISGANCIVMKTLITGQLKP